jgi:hypothetical protein
LRRVSRGSSRSLDPSNPTFQIEPSASDSSSRSVTVVAQPVCSRVLVRYISRQLMLVEPTLQTAKRVCESLAVPTASDPGIRWYRDRFRRLIQDIRDRAHALIRTRMVGPAPGGEPIPIRQQDTSTRSSPTPSLALPTRPSSPSSQRTSTLP